MSLKIPGTIVYNGALLARVTGGKLLNDSASGEFKFLTFDSRKITHPGQSVFFAMRGKRHDGHRFIEDCYGQGVRFFVAEEAHPAAQYPDVTFVLVRDSLQAMQKLAAYHRNRFDIPVIGITGSNGKTIIKEWLSQLLEPDYNIVKSPRSYNSQTGVPLSVWQMNSTHNLAIFEAGISQVGEMEKLQRIIQPTIGLFTNIGDAHNEGFLDIRHKTLEKLTLFTGCQVLVYCRDHAPVHEAVVSAYRQLAETGDRTPPVLFTWSQTSHADLRILDIQTHLNRTVIQVSWKQQTFECPIPFGDKASIENAIHCIAIMLVLGKPPEVIAERLKGLMPVAMRLELKQAVNNSLIINDSYSADVSSLAIALDFMNQQKHREKKTVILSDILQTGKSARILYSEVRDMLQAKGVKRLIGIGETISQYQKVFQDSGIDGEFYTSTAGFLQRFNPDRFANEIILVKGARCYHFEKITAKLEVKHHQTALEINLNALSHNINVFAGRLPEGVGLMAMVKALGYGSGSFQIGRALEHQRVNYLAVAYADEGVELRQNGISLPVMVMNPEPAGFEQLFSAKLEPEIFSFNQLETLIRFIKAGTPEELPLPIHLKLDTGMHRLGFDEEDLSGLLDTIHNYKELIRVKSIFSHLAAADNPAYDDFTRQQIQRFERMSKTLIDGLPYPVLRHLLNTAGIIRFPEACYDMVRLGIGLYGIDPSGIIKDALLPVGRLRTSIAQIKRIRKGEYVGYNCNFAADAEMTIGVINIGYADGLRRILGNGRGKVAVRGKRVPIIGNVCMDMTIIDLTGIPEAQPGDEVVIFGENPTLDEVAQWMDTIPYEVLTGISSRVKRIYFQE